MNNFISFILRDGKSSIVCRVDDIDSIEVIDAEEFDVLILKNGEKYFLEKKSPSYYCNRMRFES